MLIQSILYRPGGTVVTLGGQTYHFIPAAQYPNKPHLCDVTNEAHIARFLSIPEGYRVYIAPTASGTPAIEAASAAVLAKAQADAPAIGQGSAPAMDAAASTATKAPKATSSKSAKASAATAAAPASAPTTDADKEALATATSDYFTKFGKQPDASMTVDQITAAIASGKAE